MAKKLFEVLSPREKELRANLKTLKLDHSLDSETLSRRSTPDEVKAELRSKMSFRQTKINNIENEIERLNPSIKPGNVIDLNDTRFKNNGKFKAVSNIRHSGVFHLIHDTDTGKKHLVNPQSGEVIYHDISSEQPVQHARMMGFEKINEGFLNEKLDPKADMKEWIRDFLDSNAPQFKGKTKKEKIKMAIAAYYDTKRSSKKKNVKEEAEFVNENVPALIGRALTTAQKGLPSLDRITRNKVTPNWKSIVPNTVGALSLGLSGEDKPNRPVSSAPQKSDLEGAESRFQAAKKQFLKTQSSNSPVNRRNLSSQPAVNIQPADANDPVARVNRLSNTVADMNKRFQKLYPDANIPDYNPTPIRSIEDRMGPVKAALEKKRDIAVQNIMNDPKPGGMHPGIDTERAKRNDPDFKEVTINGKPTLVHKDEIPKLQQMHDRTAKEYPDFAKKTKKKTSDKKPGEQHPGVDYQQESYHWANEEDHEGEMILSQLMSISEKTAQLCKSIDEDDQFEGWVQAKITKAEDYINSVYNYLMYRKNDDNGYDEKMHDVMKSSMPMIKMNIMKLRKESKE
jgi:hypothetical protein